MLLNSKVLYIHPQSGQHINSNKVQATVQAAVMVAAPPGRAAVGPRPVMDAPVTSDCSLRCYCRLPSVACFPSLKKKKGEKERQKSREGKQIGQGLHDEMIKYP